ncbi:MAG: hypothetical protein FWH04_05665 [Oscillospiraceae bacterium]|nr:hypothetical protein [Oscillospiraceae bacterium]
MKRRILLYVVWLVCVILMTGCKPNPLAQSGNNRNDGTMLTTFEYEKRDGEIAVVCHFGIPSIIPNDDGTDSIMMTGLSNTYETFGLPFLTVKLALPKDSAIEAVTASWGEEAAINDVVLRENEYEATEDSASKDNSLADTKNQWMASASVQEFYGVRVAYVTVFPVSYQPEQKLVSYCGNAKVLLSLKESKWNLSRFDSDAEQEIKEIVDNPGDVGDYI